jgi:hypothetical protein
MIAIAAGVRIVAASRPVDFRNGLDGLAALVRSAPPCRAWACADTDCTNGSRQGEEGQAHGGVHATPYFSGAPPVVAETKARHASKAWARDEPVKPAL